MLKYLSILILMFLILACEQKETETPFIPDYDIEYFNALINGDSVSLNSVSDYFSFHSSYQNEDYTESDSIIIIYGFNVTDKEVAIHVYFYTKIPFPVYQAKTLNNNGSEIYYLAYNFVNNNWTALADSFEQGKEGYIMCNSNSVNNAVQVKYSSQNKEWFAVVNNKKDDEPGFNCNIKNAYVKNVVTNLANNTDGVLYIEGELNCTLYNQFDESEVKIENAEFRVNIAIKHDI